MDEARLKEVLAEPRHERALPDESNCIAGLLDLIKYTEPKRVLEIGCHKGVSTEAFLLTCEWVTSVDPWDDERVYQHFLHRVKDYPGLTIRGRSPQALQMIGNDTFDLCYIDAVHEYDDIMADIRGCWPYVKWGGWISGHDYGFLAIRMAVEKLLGGPDQIFRDDSWCVHKLPGKFEDVL
jgi:predicted O-methyltransferase YrrM